MKAPAVSKVKTTLFVICVIALVSIPFVLFGEGFVQPLLESKQQQTGALILIAVALLAADSVAPVPATLVIMFLAAHAGRGAGVIGGTIGMSLGVLGAAWVGRTAVGRLAPKFFPEAELVRLRTMLSRRLMVTLACLRSVPVLAETSIIVAAAMGIPIGRIFRAALLPNFVVAIIYSVAADDSPKTAAITFLATMIASYVLWRWLGRGAGPEEKAQSAGTGPT